MAVEKPGKLGEFVSSLCGHAALKHVHPFLRHKRYKMVTACLVNLSSDLTAVREVTVSMNW